MPYPIECLTNPFFLTSFLNELRNCLNVSGDFFLSSSCTSLGGNGGKRGKTKNRFVLYLIDFLGDTLESKT